jgi:predicted Fe-S protein YdhL (DUF1289 family)
MITPCIDVCRLDKDSRLCVGCRRTAEEIAAWRGLSNGQRRRIMAQLPKRKV